MKKLLAATAAIGLAMTAAPALADHHMEGETSMSAEQQAMYDGWEVDQQTTFDAWPAAAQTYYWTLDDTQQDIWWNALNNDQRVRIVGMNPQARAAAWTSINAQMAENAATPSANASATTETTPSRSANSSASPATREYPPCRGEVQDSCINPREAGLNYGNRPLNYWPGRPASEIDGPLPANEPGA